MGGIFFLGAVWWVSVGLAGVSVAGTLVLIVSRVFSTHREKALDRRRIALRMVVYRYLDGEDECLDEIRFDATDPLLLREIIEGLATTLDGSSRERLIELTGRLGGAEALIEDLRGGAERDRLRAVDSLSLFSEPEVIAALRAALDDPSPRVQLAAADALLDMGEDLSIRFDLVGKLDIGGAIRSRGLRSLFRKLASGHVPGLVAVLEGDDGPPVKVLALYALAAIQDPELVPVIAKQLRSPSLDVRAEAVRVLAAIGHPSALPLILEALRDPLWEVRAEAAICAGSIGDPQAVPDLLRLLADSHWWVRLRSAQALKRLGSEGIAALREAATLSSSRGDLARMVLAEETAP